MRQDTSSYPLSSVLDEALERARKLGPRPSGVPRESYLDRAERIVRMAASWVDEGGAVVDPWRGEEATYETGRFVGALGGLVGAGRCLDLVGLLERTIRRLLDFFRREAMREDVGTALEFHSKELAWAIWNAGGSLSEELVSDVRSVCSSWDAYRLYRNSLAYRRPSELHNVNTFALAGEAMFRALGLRKGDGFVEKHVPVHLGRFDELGMYRDPGCPVVYDWVSRLNLHTLLWAGYNGPGSEELKKVLRRGAMTQLLLHNSQGLAWFGGRSNQFLFNEMELAPICELVAADLEDPFLAGAFRRAARISLRALDRWLDMAPPRHIKNSFHPAVEWGCDSYGPYAVYLLLAASLMTFAYHWGADGPEYPIPSEVLDYTLELGPDFHKLFASFGEVNLQWDLKADPHYDATGLGRVLWGDAPPELLLSAPCPSEPKFSLPSWTRPRALSLSCAWYEGRDWTRLAESCPEGWEVQRKPRGLRVVYRLRGREVHEEVEVEGNFLRITWRVPGAYKVRAEVPVIATDGETTSEVSISPGGVVVRYRGWTYAVGVDGVEVHLLPGSAANRNALYRLVALEAEGDAVSCTLEVRRG